MNAVVNDCARNVAHMPAANSAEEFKKDLMEPAAFLRKASAAVFSFVQDQTVCV
jgi:hypothetical protein